MAYKMVWEAVPFQFSKVNSLRNDVITSNISHLTFYQYFNILAKKTKGGYRFLFLKARQVLLGKVRAKYKKKEGENKENDLRILKKIKIFN